MYTITNLIRLGLLCEIFGASILAMDAIGINSHIVVFFTSARKRKVLLSIASLAAMAGIITTLHLDFDPGFISDFQRFRIARIIFYIIFTMFINIALYVDILAVIVILLSSNKKKQEMKVKILQGIGFSFLYTGFVLQFVGIRLE